MTFHPPYYPEHCEICGRHVDRYNRGSGLNSLETDGDGESGSSRGALRCADKPDCLAHVTGEIAARWLAS